MNDCKIVGIGASAGGLQALMTFFENTDAENATYIVVQHLSANRKSKLADILAPKTNMPVLRIEDSVEMESGKIYVMTEATEIEVHDNHIQVFSRDQSIKINNSINRLFFSMAKHCKKNAVGVILSGTGTDGLEGARAIEANGGCIFVQSPESAQFDGMPNAIINLDHPDYIDDPADLAKSVMELLNTR